jgi:hypothetical protein
MMLRENSKTEVASIRTTIAYLALSALSGFLELGGVAIPIRENGAFLEALAIGACYQFATVIADTVSFGRKGYCLVLTLGFIFSLLTLKWHSLIFGAIILMGITIQLLRDATGRVSNVASWKKRVARIVGFSSAGFFDRNLLAGIGGVLAVLTVFAFSLVKLPVQKAPLRQRLRGGKISIVMMIHQSHYFAYAYTVPFIFISIHKLLGFKFAGAYALGWLTYTFAFRVFDAGRPLISLVIGHLLTSASLLMMYVYAENLWLFLLISLISGLGGGTVFCITVLRRRWGEEKVDMTVWENWGHVIGVLLAIFVVALGQDPTSCLIVGSILAVATGLTSVIADMFYSTGQSRNRK